MDVTTKAILLVLMLLMAACSTLSQPEQRLDIPAQIVDAKTLPDPATEFDVAKQECANKGGEWLGYIHGDGFEFYFYRMRCVIRDDQGRHWEEPGLLPYEVEVSYSIETRKVIGFSRVEPDSPAIQRNGDQDTTDQPQ